jgi:hypothetical protein
MGKLNLSSLNVKAFIGGYPFAWLTKKNKQSQYCNLSPENIRSGQKEKKEKNEKEPPYYERYISKNKDWPDYTDYSGGLWGI